MVHLGKRVVCTCSDITTIGAVLSTKGFILNIDQQPLKYLKNSLKWNHIHLDGLPTFRSLYLSCTQVGPIKSNC